MDYTDIAFIGGGNMARSLVGGLIADGQPPGRLWVTNPTPEKLLALQNDFGVHVTRDNREGASHADALVFAVKPQGVKTVATELAGLIRQRRPLVISIAAGVTETAIRAWLGGAPAIVRCMPNTPALVRSGAAALYANAHVSGPQKRLAESILRAVGTVLWVKEEAQLDTVTALSGCGPAYFFLVMEALQSAAETLGLPAEDARLLTLQTALGAAKMAMESRQSPAQLRHQVTSPGGTTEAALRVLETGRIRQLFLEALTAARGRAGELAKLFGAP